MNADNQMICDLTDPEAEFPLRWLFRVVRDRWIAKKSGRSQRTIAERFDVPFQRVSQWATGTDARRGDPPWHIITTLADELGVEIRIAGDGVRLVRRRKLKPENEND